MKLLWLIFAVGIITDEVPPSTLINVRIYKINKKGNELQWRNINGLYWSIVYIWRLLRSVIAFLVLCFKQHVNLLSISKFSAKGTNQDR